MAHQIHAAIVAMWYSVGQLLLGIFVGAYVSRYGQRKQWVLDGKKTEYRELLSTLAQCTHTILKNWSVPIARDLSMQSGEQERASFEARIEGQRIIEDRIFIAQRIQKEKIRERWQHLIGVKDILQFHSGMDELHQMLIKAALKDLGIEG